MGFIIRTFFMPTNQETDQETSQELSNNQETDQEGGEKISNRIMIIEAIRNNPSITQKQLESITGLSRSGVRYILRKLQDENVLHRVGATKNGQWIFTGNNRDHFENPKDDGDAV